MKVRRTAAVAVVAMAALVGGAVALASSLGSEPAPRLVPDPASRPSEPPGPAAALALWNGFPVDADPRPLVLFDAHQYSLGLDINPHQNGFARGQWILPDRLPDAPKEADGYPVVPAAAAVEELRRTIAATEVELYTKVGRAEVSSVRLETRRFTSDRGAISLPAWVVTFADFEEGDGEATVVAVHPSRLFPLPAVGRAQSSVTASPDGRTLTYEFTGAAPGDGPCEAEYSAVVQESATAVAVGALEQPGHSNRPFGGGEYACTSRATCAA